MSNENLERTELNYRLKLQELNANFMGDVRKPNIIFKNPFSQQEIDDYEQEREEGLGDRG